MDRDFLGALWTRWYVDRANPRQEVGIVEHGPELSRQLRVRDLDEPDVWTAMSDRAGKIAHYEARYRSIDGVSLIVPVWLSPEGPVIIDGNHRACALHRLNPPTLDIDVLALPVADGCFDLLPGPRS